MIIDAYDHIPVLVKEVLHGLQVRPDGIYVDCTFGRGGHSRSILEQLGNEGKLYVFDKDPDAIRCAQQLASEDTRLRYFHAAFTSLHDNLESAGDIGAVDGVLFDFGVSSPQLDDAARGFSFSMDGELDMRMNPQAGISAADWINHTEMDDITYVLKVYGEEKFARRISRAIVEARSNKLISRTSELAEIISSAIPVRERNKHPATRSFQAIRIFINNELEEITEGLKQAFDVLRINGRLLAISFHSLEDRIVKRFMREYSLCDPYPKNIPIPADLIKPKLKTIGKAIRPSQTETSVNPRSRSAVLRIAEKLTV